jgi:dTDP-L-rhamnose 4-epimerase
MTIKNILVTGGAGFIGSHITDNLIKEGYKVTILDNLDKQVHQGKIPTYLNKKAKFIKGDILNPKIWQAVLKNVDAIYHEASVVGVGQSMYDINYYVKNNSLGTANLLDYLANNKHTVKRLFIASSMSAYGEGLYQCPKCGKIRPDLRTNDQMAKKKWELYCPNCKSVLSPIPTPETEKFACNSIYAVTKQSQEDMCMIFGRAYNIPVTAFRYFNVYGPRQSLSNPYTGVAAIFLSRLKNNNSPVIYEDGLQSRDFTSVYDIANANTTALLHPQAFHQIFNLGTGNPVSVKDVSLTLAKLLDLNIEPTITAQFRPGDVRYCYADISKIYKMLKWKPQFKFEQGMIDLIDWGKNAKANDKFEIASNKLSSKGLVK